MHDATTSQAALLPEPPAQTGRSFLFVSIALLSSVGLTGWMDVANCETYTGYLHAGTTTITADHDAVIHRILADEGQVLAINQAVVELVNAGLESQLSAKRLEVAALQVELEQSRARAEVELSSRLRNLDAEILSTQLKSADYMKDHFTQQVGREAWRHFLKDYDTATAELENGFFQPVHYNAGTPAENRVRAMLAQETALNSAEVYGAQVKLCDQHLAKLEKQKRELPVIIRQAMGVDVAENHLKQVRGAIALLESRQRELTLTTSAYGTVGVFQKRAGQRVVAGEPIVEILDQDRRFLVLQIPSRRIGSFEAGIEVGLRFPNGEKRTGKIRQIPPQTSPATQLASVSDGKDSLVPIHIDSIDKLWPSIPIGSAVEVIVSR